MHSLPLSVFFVDRPSPVQLTIRNCNDEMIGMLEFVHIDQAMFFLSPFAANQMRIKNPRTLRELLEENSEIPYVFYDGSNKINRRETIFRVMRETEHKTVAAIHRFTGFPISRIAESISRLKHDNPAAT